MGTTVAFLRGINVAGHKMTAMADVVRIFESLGFASVRTYIQSGNVLFNTRTRSLGRLRLKIERALHDELGAEVTVLLRTLSEVVGIVKRDPFKKNRVPRAKPFVTFMSETPGETPALPLRSRKGDVEVFEIVGTEAFSLSIEKTVVLASRTTSSRRNSASQLRRATGTRSARWRGQSGSVGVGN